MRDIFSFARKTGLGAMLGAAFGLLAFGQAAEAANPLELNFWLRSGPSPRNSRKKKATTGIPGSRSRLTAGFTKSPTGPGSRTIFRAAIAAAT
jgi:hypothetical protein